MLGTLMGKGVIFSFIIWQANVHLFLFIYFSLLLLFPGGGGYGLTASRYWVKMHLSDLGFGYTLSQSYHVYPVTIRIRQSLGSPKSLFSCTRYGSWYGSCVGRGVLVDKALAEDCSATIHHALLHMTESLKSRAAQRSGCLADHTMM